MKIAFVGKGGSGKSTVAALFIQHLRSINNPILAVDADINIHLPSLLGVSISPDQALSSPENKLFIRDYLRGTNPRIPSASHMVKTTPPGEGSNFITPSNTNPVISKLAISIDPHTQLLFVGTYEASEIGTACYHTNLSIFENILSHTILSGTQWLVADMVAGTDAFSNTLHAQFDAIVLVIEPTPEGLSVFNQYSMLAKAADILPNLYVIGNKVEDQNDFDYLAQHVGSALIGSVGLHKSIKQSRQNSQAIELKHLSDAELNIFDTLTNSVAKDQDNSAQKLAKLHSLHLAYVAQDYIKNELGDISNQIDPSFQYPQI